MKLLYFAWVRQTLGRSEESFDPPAEVTTVADLIAHLRDRGGAYAEALKETAAIRVAVNQVFAEADAPVRAGDEVAIFPPVTGG
ncbi:MAG: molybdopterin converting factor subunit 1 [Pseudomonadota bacterium]